MDTRELPDLAPLSERLATDAQRVQRHLGALIERLDALVAAAAKADWTEVRLQGEHLVRSAAAYGYPEIAERARDLCITLGEADGSERARRQIVELVGRCGRLRSLAP